MDAQFDAGRPAREAARAAAKPSLRSAARGVEKAWTQYLDDDNVDGMAAAIAKLREALA